MRTKCERCGGEIEFDPEYLGQVSECPYCAHQTPLVPPSSKFAAILRRLWKPFVALALFVALFGWPYLVFDADDARATMFMLMFVAWIVGLYFLPVIIAQRLGHRNICALALVNVFFGWTLLGWVGALVWAVYQERR